MARGSLIPRESQPGRGLDVFRDLGQQMEWMGREMDRMFDRFLGSYEGRYEPRWFAHDWSGWPEGPACDVLEEDGAYVVRFQVPGYSKDDIRVDVTKDAVTLKGEHRKTEETEQGRWVCRESAQGAFERMIRLPGEVKTDGVSAKLKDGVLTLTVPKAEGHTHRQIEVTEVH